MKEEKIVGDHRVQVLENGKVYCSSCSQEATEEELKKLPCQHRRPPGWC